jgi:hypothetical protein
MSSGCRENFSSFRKFHQHSEAIISRVLKVYHKFSILQMKGNEDEITPHFGFRKVEVGKSHSSQLTTSFYFVATLILHTNTTKVAN